MSRSVSLSFVALGIIIVVVGFNLNDMLAKNAPATCHNSVVNHIHNCNYFHLPEHKQKEPRQMTVEYPVFVKRDGDLVALSCVAYDKILQLVLKNNVLEEVYLNNQQCEQVSYVNDEYLYKARDASLSIQFNSPNTQQHKFDVVMLHGKNMSAFNITFDPLNYTAKCTSRLSDKAMKSFTDEAGIFEVKYYENGIAVAYEVLRDSPERRVMCVKGSQISICNYVMIDGSGDIYVKKCSGSAANFIADGGYLMIKPRQGLLSKIMKTQNLQFRIKADGSDFSVLNDGQSTQTDAKNVTSAVATEPISAPSLEPAMQEQPIQETVVQQSAQPAQVIVQPAQDNTDIAMEDSTKNMEDNVETKMQNISMSKVGKDAETSLVQSAPAKPAVDRTKQNQLSQSIVAGAQQAVDAKRKPYITYGAKAADTSDVSSYGSTASWQASYAQQPVQPAQSQVISDDWWL